MRIRILAVEDNAGHFELLTKQLIGIVEDLTRFAQRHGQSADAHERGDDTIRPFQGMDLDHAKDRDAAKELMKKADASIPYHLLLADLKIPPNAATKTDHVKFGLEVLDFALESGAALQILAMSSFNTERDAYQHRANDWISKPIDPAALRDKLLVAWKVIIAIECRDILQRRFRWLIPHVRYLVTARFGNRFAELVNGATQAARDLRSLLPERLLIDTERDSGDPILQELDRLQCVIEKSKREWSLLSPAEIPALAPIRLEDQLRCAFEQVEPLWIQRRSTVALPKGTTQVADFGGNVELVLRELLMGPLLAGAPPKERREFAITLTTSAGFAEVTIHDDLDPLSADDIEKIDQGATIAPSPDFGRAWGLSIVQHAAINGGGGIAVKSGSLGTDVTYKIPLMR